MLLKPLPKINKVFAMIVQHECQMSLTLPIGESVVFFNLTSNRGGRFGRCYGRRFGRGIGRHNKQRPLCTYCGMLGHMIDKCYKKHGFL